MSESLSNITEVNKRQMKLIKRTASVLKVINDYFIGTFMPSDETKNRWNDEEVQNKLRLLIKDKKIKCQKEEDDEETKMRKQLRKEEKKITKLKSKAEKQINKLKGKPKSACHYFIHDERVNVLREHPEWNPKEHKKEIYLELQNRWKVARTTDKFVYYTNMAENEYKNMTVPEKKPFVPYKRPDAKTPKVGPDGKAITKYNKNKYKNIPQADMVKLHILNMKTKETIEDKEFKPRFVDFRKVSKV